MDSAARATPILRLGAKWGLGMHTRNIIILTPHPPRAWKEERLYVRRRRRRRRRRPLPSLLTFSTHALLIHPFYNLAVIYSLTISVCVFSPSAGRPTDRPRTATTALPLFTLSAHPSDGSSCFFTILVPTRVHQSRKSVFETKQYTHIVHNEYAVAVSVK